MHVNCFAQLIRSMTAGDVSGECVAVRWIRCGVWQAIKMLRKDRIAFGQRGMCELPLDKRAKQMQLNRYIEMGVSSCKRVCSISKT